MIAVTSAGTQVILETHDNSPKTYTIGGMREKAPADGMFKLATWSKKSQSDVDVTFSVTFIQADGATKTYDLKGNTLFTENPNANLVQAYNFSVSALKK